MAQNDGIFPSGEGLRGKLRGREEHPRPQFTQPKTGVDNAKAGHPLNMDEGLGSKPDQSSIPDGLDEV